jgi:dTDP-4-amino-4,6-dideoxygalactose transaminase
MRAPELPAILGGPKTVTESPPHFPWPRTTEEIRRSVLAQLERTISIRDGSDVFERFGGAFAAEHGRKHWSLYNSGRSALFCAYQAFGLEPGDEVVCPAYTFHGTVTPMLLTGARPVFCDSGEDGNIDPSEIERAITERTKAIVVTHLWGIPCDMERITAIAKSRRLRLLEDCSHAHGAEIGGRKVGTFGDAAVWSLQAQKTLAAGEGGILLTDDADIHTRTLLFSDSHQRTPAAVDRGHSLHPYLGTGAGLKLRPHPLAIAMVEPQLRHMEELLKQRNIFVTYMMDMLRKYDCLKLPETEGKQPSWYALVAQYDPARANGLPQRHLHEALLAEGLLEVKRPDPRSTGDIHALPIFRNPEEVFPALYKEAPAKPEHRFPRAEKFSAHALQLPVGSSEAEWPMTEKYVAGIRKVLEQTRALAEKLL